MYHYVHYFLYGFIEKRKKQKQTKKKSSVFSFFEIDSVKTEKSASPFLQNAGKIDRIRKTRVGFMPVYFGIFKEDKQ